MKLPKMGKPSYLKPHHIQQDDLVEIIGEPYVQSEEESKFGRQRGYAVIRLLRTGDTYTWGLNTTTWDRLINAFGDDSGLWIEKKVKLKMESQTIRGEEKQIIFGIPYKEPQKQITETAS